MSDLKWKRFQKQTNEARNKQRNMRMMANMSKYISIKMVEEKPKTKVWEIFSRRHGSCLGVIKWYAPWRQYVFFPLSETIWNKDCLETVVQFIKHQMELRRK